MKWNQKSSKMKFLFRSLVTLGLVCYHAASVAASKSQPNYRLRERQGNHRSRVRELQGEEPHTVFSTNLPVGIWTFRGYGWVLNVTAAPAASAATRSSNGEALLNAVNMLEETNISCVQNDMLLGYIDLDRVQILENNLAVLTASKATSTEYTLDRLVNENNENIYRAGCNKGATKYSPNPLFNFDVLDQTFKEHYAFFETRNIDWDAVASEARSQLKESSTEQELFEVATSLLGILNDPHVLLSNGIENFNAYHPSDKPMYERYIDQLDAADGIANPDQYIATVGTAEWRQAVGTRYMVDGTLSNGGSPLGWSWGRFKNCKEAMEGLDDLHGDASLGQAWDSVKSCTPKRVGYIEVPAMQRVDGDLEAWLSELDTALTDLSDTDTIVIDVRFNQGGYEAYSLMAAARFTRERVYAFSKRAYYDSGHSFTEEQQVYVDPQRDNLSGTYYDGEVIVIASSFTVSAGEGFIFAMSQLPQVTLLGRPTMGALSDMLQKNLPNGWYFTISNEIYTAADGEVYEVIGFPPDILTEMEANEQEILLTGSDSWLDLALEEAKVAPYLSSASSTSTTSFGWNSLVGVLVVVGCISIM